MLIDDLNIILSTYDNDSHEYIISQFIIDHWKEINNLKKKDIISQVGVSISTLSRFCQKLGFNNFTELKSCIFKEMSSLPVMKTDNDDIHDFLKELLKSTKRIIVIGDKSSMTPLFIYKRMFYNIGIDLDIQLNFNTTPESFHKFTFKQNDIVFFVSIFQSFLSLTVSHYIDYIEIENDLYKKDIPCIFIGKIDRFLYFNSKTKYFIDFQHEYYSLQVSALCHLFESIYCYLETDKNSYH